MFSIRKYHVSVFFITVQRKVSLSDPHILCSFYSRWSVLLLKGHKELKIHYSFELVKSG